MSWFLGGIALLVLGYFTYGRLVERLLPPDDRKTPCVAGLLAWSNEDAASFNHLWNYFAWMNQLLSTTMLFVASVWLMRKGRGAKSLVALIPGVFMCLVISTFAFWAWPTKGQVWGLVPGGLPLPGAFAAAAAVTALCVACVVRSGRRAASCHAS